MKATSCEAEDGADALSRLGVGIASVDVVVRDVVMPRLNGVGLLQAITALHPRLPVILMSGYATGQLQGMGIAAPCGILLKPFSNESLLQEVRRCLAEEDPFAASIPGATP